jgi:hypothetical protein
MAFSCAARGSFESASGHSPFVVVQPQPTLDLQRSVYTEVGLTIPEFIKSGTRSDEENGLGGRRKGMQAKILFRLSLFTRGLLLSGILKGIEDKVRGVRKEHSHFNKSHIRQKRLSQQRFLEKTVVRN